MTTLAEDSRKLASLRQRYERASADAKVYKEEMDRAEMALFERMEHEDVGSIKVGRSNFVRAATTYGQVQDRGAFVAWAEDERPELVELKERKALLNEIVRECLEDGVPLPPGLGFYVKQYVSQRAA